LEKYAVVQTSSTYHNHAVTLYIKAHSVLKCTSFDLLSD